MARVVVLLMLAVGCGSAQPATPEVKASAAEVAALLQRADPTVPSCSEAAPPAPPSAPPSMVLQDGHTEYVMDLELSRDGRILASAGMDGIARVWDTHAGLLLRRVRGANHAFALSLSADGRLLALFAPPAEGKRDVPIQIHDLESSAPPVIIGAGNFLFALTPDGDKLVVATDGVTIYDAKSGSPVAQTRFARAQGMSMDADGKRIAVAASGELLVLELAGLRILQRMPNPHYQGPADTAGDLVLAGSNLWLRTGTGQVHRYDLASGADKGTLPGMHVHMVLGKERLYTISEGKVLSWDPASGAAKGGAGRADPIAARKLAASGDGSTLALASVERDNPISIRDAASTTTLRTLRGATSPLAAAAVDPSGRQIATTSRLGALMRWDARTGKLVGRGEGASVSFDDSGNALASIHGAVVRVERGSSVQRWQAHTGSTTFAAFSSKSKTLVTAGSDGAVKRWEIDKPREKKVADVGFAIQTAALSESGKLLAVVGTRAAATLEVALVDLASERVRWRTTIPKSLRPFAHVALDDKSVLVSFDQMTSPTLYEAMLKIYDADSGKLVKTRPIRYNAPLALAGGKLAIGGARPSIERWPGPSTPKEVTLFDVEVTGIASDPRRGGFVFVGSSGGATLVDGDGNTIATMVATDDGEFLTSTPDGAFVASLDGRRAAGWSFTEPLEAVSFAELSESYERPDVVADRLGGKAGAPLAAITRPPRIELERTPKEAAATLALRAAVSSNRRVDRMRVFVNARPVVDKLVCSKDAKVSVDVPLQPGRNRVTAVAYDADGHASSPVSRDVVSTVHADKPALWAVAVGVSRYPKLAARHQLEYADDDARSIVTALDSLAGKGRPFAALRATTLIDERVDPDSVERALAGLAKMKPQDLAVVFLAGHGLRLADGGMVFLTSTSDLTGKKGGVGWDRIEGVLRGARGRVVLLLDACHSGHVSTELVAANEELATRLQADNRAGVLVFAAARGSELSYEVPDRGTAAAGRSLELAWEGTTSRVNAAKGHGLFTSAVLEALGGKAVDRDRSGGIELGEFIDYVTERVREASNGKQTPWVARRELFGDFYVAPARR